MIDLTGAADRACPFQMAGGVGAPL